MTNKSRQHNEEVDLGKIFMMIGNSFNRFFQFILPVVKNLFTNHAKRVCEWPEGHPDESDFKFCGKDRFEDKPYCLDHCAVAYVIPEKDEAEKQEVTQRA